MSLVDSILYAMASELLARHRFARLEYKVYLAAWEIRLRLNGHRAVIVQQLARNLGKDQPCSS